MIVHLGSQCCARLLAVSLMSSVMLCCPALRAESQSDDRIDSHNDGTADGQAQQIAGPAGVLATWTMGSADAPEAVIVLHGGPGLSHHYTRSLAACFVGERRQAVCYDQRGVGGSDAGPLRLADYLADCAAVRQAVGRPHWLVGHSWGAIVAALSAVEDQSDCLGVVLINPMPPTRDQWVAANMQFNQRIAELSAQGLVPQGAATIPDWASYSTDQQRVLSIMPVYYADPQHPAARSLGGSTANMSILNATHTLLGDSWDLRPQLQNMPVWTMVMHGRDDGFGLAMGEAMHAALPERVAVPEHSANASTSGGGVPNPLVIIDDAGHLPWVEQPDVFQVILHANLGP